MKPADRILDFIYPRKCAFCHKKMGSEEGILCSSCSASLPYTGKNGKQHIPFTRNCYSPLYYEGDVRDSLHRYKFGGLNMYSQVYAEIINRFFSASEEEADIITWVPLSRARLRSRGYDQARLLAEELANRNGIPCEGVLKKIKNVKPQSKTGAFESRAKNIKGAYTVPDPERIAGKKVLLADDIITTGATVSECAATLLEAGARSVSVVTVARRRE